MLIAPCNQVKALNDHLYDEAYIVSLRDMIINYLHFPCLCLGFVAEIIYMLMHVEERRLIWSSPFPDPIIGGDLHPQI